jgi:hypothetical protein
MKFNREVTVGLSFDGFRLSASQISRIKIYWYNESSGRWVLVDSSPTIDDDEEVIWFSTNHFSRYAWSDDSTGGSNP